MKNKSKWLLTLIVISVTSIILYSNRKVGLDYKTIIENRMIVWQQFDNTFRISGIGNNYHVYEDININNFKDLMAVSELGVHIKVMKTWQDSDAVFIEGEILQIISGKAEVNDNVICFVYPNIISTNDYSEQEGIYNKNKLPVIKLEFPFLGFAEGQEYTVFLNRINNLNNVYRVSTTMYSVIPYKEEIIIKLYDPLDRISCDIKEYDYLYNRNNNIDDSVLEVLDETEKQLYLKGNELSKNSLERYMDICFEINKILQLNTSIDLLE